MLCCLSMPMFALSVMCFILETNTTCPGVIRALKDHIRRSMPTSRPPAQDVAQDVSSGGFSAPAATRETARSNPAPPMLQHDRVGGQWDPKRSSGIHAARASAKRSTCGKATEFQAAKLGTGREKAAFVFEPPVVATNFSCSSHINWQAATQDLPRKVNSMSCVRHKERCGGGFYATNILPNKHLHLYLH